MNLSLRQALKYANSTAVKELSNSMHLNDWLAADHPFNPEGHIQDQVKRGVLADAYEEETGHTEGANLLRDPSKTVVMHNGKLVEGVLRHRDAASDFGGDQYDPDTDQLYPIHQHLEDGDIDAAHTEAAVTYDMGEGNLTEDPPYGSGDHKDHQLVGGPFTTFAHNPRSGYWSLTEHHILPLSQSHKTYLYGRG